MATAPKAYTINHLAQETGVDRVKLGKVLAGVDPDATDGERDKWLIKTVVKHLLYGVSDKTKTSLEAATAQTAENKAQLSSIALKEKQGLIVEIAEVQQVLEPLFTAIKTRILALPTRLAARLAGLKEASAIKVVLDKSVRDALEEVSNFDPSNIELNEEKK